MDKQDPHVTSLCIDDLMQYLPLLEFVYNNTIHSSIDTTPFFASYGFHPPFIVNILATFVNPSSEKLRVRIIKEVNSNLTINSSILKKCIELIDNRPCHQM